MKIISKGDKKSDLHTVQRESAYSTQKPPPRQSFKHQTPYGDQNKKDSTGRRPCRLQFKSKGCFRCGNTHDRSASCPAKNSKCNHWGKTAIMQECACSNAFKRFTRSWAVQSTRAKTSTEKMSTPLMTTMMCTLMTKNQRKKQATLNPSLCSLEPSPQQRASKPKKYH